MPSDQFQVIALVQLMKHFGWSWVGIVYSTETYSVEGTVEFIKEAKKEGICVEYTELFQKIDTVNFNKIVETITHSTSRVVLVFMSLSYTQDFLKKVGRNVTGKQLIGSESWITTASLALESGSVLQGAMGFAIPESDIPGLNEFLLSLKPSDAPQSSHIRVFWEDVFHCSFSPSNTSKLCTGSEDLRTVVNDYTDTTETRTVNNVYMAVYAVAHALHNLLQCENGLNPTTGRSCINKTEVMPQQVKI